MLEIVYSKDVSKLSKKAVGILVDAILELSPEQDQVVLALPGGRSIVSILEDLAADSRIDWTKVHVFMIDERLVDIDNDQSNFKLVKEKLQKPNIHPYFEVDQYENELKHYGGKYDIIVLGVGEDGHVGALYPNHHSIEDKSEFYLKMNDSPKPPSGRMSSSLKLLKSAKYSLALFLGEAKLQAYKNFNNQDLDISDCPAKLINEIEKTYVITDLQ